MKCSVVLVTLFAVLPLDAQSIKIPNGTLHIAYRQRESSQLSKSVHEVQRSCWNGSCSLLTLTLNQCVEIVGEKFFWLKMERSTTFLQPRTASVTPRAAGAATKDSVLLNKIISWDLVSVKGQHPVVKLDCDEGSAPSSGRTVVFK